MINYPRSDTVYYYRILKMEGCLIIAFRRSVNSEIRAKNKLNVNSNLWHIAEYDDFINFRVSKMTYIVSGGALNSTHSH